MNGESLWPSVTIPLMVAFFIFAALVHNVEPVFRRSRLSVDRLLSAEDGPPGVVVPIHRRVDGWGLAGITVGGAVLVAGAVAAEGGWRVFWALLAVPFLLLAAHWLWTWPMSHRMVLSTEGVLVQDGRQSAYLAWDDMMYLNWGVGDRRDMVYTIVGHPGASSWWCERRSWHYRPERVSIVVRTMCIDLDPLLLGWALMTYFKHPEMRGDLVTGTARSRLLDPGYARAVTPSDVSTVQPFPRYRPW
ncbi:MAG: hypothetical protein FWH11_06135 [Micrococcales bacterium]|nr:hypothetical protein [Micrococcales bacterium]